MARKDDGLWVALLLTATNGDAIYIPGIETTTDGISSGVLGAKNHPRVGPLRNKAYYAGYSIRSTRVGNGYKVWLTAAILECRSCEASLNVVTWIENEGPRLKVDDKCPLCTYSNGTLVLPKKSVKAA